MSSLTKPYTFTGGTYAIASQVNADLDTLYNWVNGGSAIWADASVAFTGVPTGPGLDPTAANHLARKSYVDAGDSNAQSNAIAASAQGWTGSAWGKVKIQAGSNVITTNASGSGTVTFPQAFSSLLGVVICEGDWSGSTIVSLSVIGTGATTGFNFHADQNSGILANSVVRVNWIAIGL